MTNAEDGNVDYETRFYDKFRIYIFVNHFV